MNVILSKLFRNTPPDSLNTYFQAYPSIISDSVNWNDPPKNITKPLLENVKNLSEEQLAIHVDNAERITEMTDEMGQSALLSVVRDEDYDDYNKIENEYARSLFVFLQDKEAFRKAEQIRYSDNYRKSRMCDAFQATKNSKIINTKESKEAFIKKISDYFKVTGNIKVEIFERDKHYSDSEEIEITHVMVYHDDMPKSYKTLENNDLVYKIYKPVIEMAISYEPKSGSLEVINKDKDSRNDIAKTVLKTLFGMKIEDAEKIPLKQYEISQFIKPYNFPCDIEDNIESVKVLMLQLKPEESKNKVTLEVSSNEKETIWNISKNWFDTNDPLNNGFNLSKIKICIKFNPDDKNPRGKTIPINITAPNCCDLKDKTRKERLISNKYLKKWGILKEI